MSEYVPTPPPPMNQPPRPREHRITMESDSRIGVMMRCSCGEWFHGPPSSADSAREAASAHLAEADDEQPE